MFIETPSFTTEIHHYLSLGGVTGFEQWMEHAKIYLMTKRLYIVTIDNNHKPPHQMFTGFAIWAHRESSALALLDELIDANYNVVSVQEFSPH